MALFEFPVCYTDSTRLFNGVVGRRKGQRWKKGGALVSNGGSQLAVVCAVVSACVSAVQRGDDEGHRAVVCVESRAEDPPNTEPLADGERSVGENTTPGTTTPD